MRCNEARQRLSALYEQRLDPASSQGQTADGVQEIDDRDLRDHLRFCSACAAFAAAERLMTRDLSIEREREIADDLPLSVARVRVDARAEAAGRRRVGHAGQPQRSMERGLSFMQKIQRNLVNKPRIGITVAVIVLLLAVGTLVPFKVEDTVGYQVALAGVSPDLALDEGRVERLLTALEVDDATFEVGDCEATCKVVISHLTDTNQVQVVIEAFKEMGNTVVEDVYVTTGGDAKKLIELVHSGTLKFFGKELTDDEIHTMVVERLDSLTGEHTKEFSVWVSHDADLHDHGALAARTQYGGDLKLEMISGHPQFEVDGQIITTEVTVVDGKATMTLTHEDGTIETLDLSDEEAIARLKEMGIAAEIAKDAHANGSVHSVFVIETDSTQDVFEFKNDADDAADETSAEKDGLVPEGFRLDQNYPNPFNPSTEIGFSIPTSERVTLDIYNIQGQRVKSLVDQVMGAGEHVVTWDGTNDAGSRVASGVYLYRLSAGEMHQSKKMSLVK